MTARRPVLSILAAACGRGRRRYGWLGQMHRDAGAASSSRDIPPPGALLDRERDVLARGRRCASLGE
jgi:hypothetical protein